MILSTLDLVLGIVSIALCVSCYMIGRMHEQVLQEDKKK